MNKIAQIFLFILFFVLPSSAHAKCEKGRGLEGDFFSNYKRVFMKYFAISFICLYLLFSAYPSYACDIEAKSDNVFFKNIGQTAECASVLVTYPKVIKEGASVYSDPTATLTIIQDKNYIAQVILNETDDLQKNGYETSYFCLNKEVITDSKLNITYKKKPRKVEGGSYIVEFCAYDILIDDIDQRIKPGLK